MYIYKSVAFRPIEKSDLEILRKLHNDPSTFLNLATIDQVDENDQFTWWENLHRIKNDERYTICFSGDPDKVIGRLRVQNIDLQNKNCETGLDILPEYRGKGYGLLSYQMILEYLFLQKNFNLVYVRLADFNPKARALYEKVGFRQTGFYRNYIFRHGKYWDYIIMCITKSDYSEV
jgi:RimJ/RimL family protein N-acetyltransferase